MAIILSSHLTLILSISLLFFSLSTIKASIQPKRLITKLIPHNSISSPTYNPKETSTDRARSDMEISIARFAFLETKILLQQTYFPSDYRLNILPTVNQLFFFINITVGVPPIPQFPMMDTGSNFLWIQCLPCKNCSKQFGPIFNPEKSSTYNAIYCNSDSVCLAYGAPSSYCNEYFLCNYTIVYGSPSRGCISKGIVAKDTVTFQTSNQNVTMIVFDVVFGCGHENTKMKIDDYRATGVFGLGDGSALLNRFGSKFSYCIGDLHDINYEHNQLILGDGARFEGAITPLDLVHGHYYLTLESISVGDNTLDIDPNIFTRIENNILSGVVIDTGTPLTWLADAAFNALKIEVKRVLSETLTEIPVDPWHLCYHGNIDMDLARFPTVTFHFADGADMDLHIWSMFRQVDPYKFCLAVLPSGSYEIQRQNLSLIGLYAQQYYNIAYDLFGKTLTFKMIDCDVLDQTW